MEEAGLEPGLNGELHVNRQRQVGRPIWMKYDYNYKHERAQESTSVFAEKAVDRPVSAGKAG